MKRNKLLFISSRALYPPYLRVIKILNDIHNFECAVIAPKSVEDSVVWQSSGKFDEKNFSPNNLTFPVFFAESKSGNVVLNGFNETKLTALLDKIEPEFIYVMDEFWEGITLQVLSLIRKTPKPIIISFAATNHLKRNPFLKLTFPFIRRTRLKQYFFWRRLDGLCACSTSSAICARKLGLNERIPIIINYLPNFNLSNTKEKPIKIPWKKEENFIIGFAGILDKRKGLEVLLNSLKGLPNSYKLIVAGEGSDRLMLLNLIELNGLGDRVYYAGLLSKEKLLASLKMLNVLVVPSISTPIWTEQFGVVIAEAMACGVPVIGSDSGAIPEIIGDAGIIVPENSSADLSDAIIKLSRDVEQQQILINNGLKRYAENFSCETYSSSVASFFDELKKKSPTEKP